MKTIVAIPIYKNQFAQDEIISITRTIEILGMQYKIVFIAPEKIRSVKEFPDIAILHFPDLYFESIASYNRLLISLEFYLRFYEYDYLLICQNDCYLFENNLEYFINLNFDYIGAPWITHAQEKFWRGYIKVLPQLGCKLLFSYLTNKKSIHVGNGGFSLRKISAFKNVLQNHSKKISNIRMQEDQIVSVAFPYLDSNFSIASLNIALSFSFDADAAIAFQMNNYQLPMCAHKFRGYDDVDASFWKKYIHL